MASCWSTHAEKVVVNSEDTQPATRAIAAGTFAEAVARV